MHCRKLEFIVLLGLLPYHSVSAIAATVKKTPRGVTTLSSTSPHPKVLDSYDSPGSNNAVDAYTIPPPSPRCWRTAWKLFQHVQQDHHNSDAQAMCSLMPEEQQKALALEIARCHLQDLGKPLIKDRAMLHQCSEGQMLHQDSLSQFDDDTNILQTCLKSLTDAGVNAYTHYISYVQQLCTRLTAELMVQHQEEQAREMMSRYQAVSQQSMDQLETLTSMWSEKHAEQMHHQQEKAREMTSLYQAASQQSMDQLGTLTRKWSEKHAEQMNTLSEIPDMIKDQLTMELKEQLRETVKEQLSEQLQIQLREQLQTGIGALLQSQAIEQASYLNHIMGHIEARDMDHKETYELWTQHQTTQWQNQAREMQHQRARMQDLDDIVSTTTKKILPLVGLQSLVAAATEGYTWITFLLYFLGTFNVVWLFTRPQRCHGFRGYLFAIVLLEAVFELSLKAMIDYDWIFESDRTLVIDEVRRWALFLECLAYVAGMVSSFFVDQKICIQQEALQQKVRVPDRQDAATPEQIMNAHAANANGNTHMIPRSYVHAEGPNHQQYSDLTAARDQHLSIAGDNWYGPSPPPQQQTPPLSSPLTDGGRPFQAGRRPTYHDQVGGGPRYFPCQELAPYSCPSTTGMEDGCRYESTDAYTWPEWSGDHQVLPPPRAGWPRNEYQQQQQHQHQHQQQHQHQHQQQQQQQQHSPTRSQAGTVVHSVHDTTHTQVGPGSDIGSPPTPITPPSTSTVPALIHSTNDDDDTPAPHTKLEHPPCLPTILASSATNEFVSRKRPAAENDILHEREQSPRKKGRYIGL